MNKWVDLILTLIIGAGTCLGGWWVGYNEGLKEGERIGASEVYHQQDLIRDVLNDVNITIVFDVEGMSFVDNVVTEANKPNKLNDFGNGQLSPLRRYPSDRPERPK